jgi:flagellar biosynthesis protein FlhG
MIDQAEKLRQIVKSIKEQRTSTNLLPAPRIVTVTSGKGGVGKTNFTINFAISLSELGQRVVIIDADFGLANVDVMLGVVPKYDLSYVIRQEKTIDDVTCMGPGGIKFISGGAGLSDLVNINPEKLEAFIKSLESLEKTNDIILIDTGAGISDKVIRMILAANETILLTTPEPTSITDAYVLAKMSLSINNTIRFRLIMNKAESHQEAELMLTKFNGVVKKFLNTEVESMGYILYDANVVKSVKEQLPYVLGYPKCLASKQIKDIARSFVSVEANKISVKRGLRSYIQILAGIWNIRREFVSKGY